MNPEKSSLQFLGYRVLFLHLDTASYIPEENIELDIEHSLRISKPSDPGDDKDYGIVLTVGISNKEKSLNLEVGISGGFSIQGDLDDEAKTKLVQKNGVAILYPYLRAFVSTLTIQAGIPPIVLPTVNLTRAFEKEPHE
jgi:preprotein translocase subunit SecB